MRKPLVLFRKLPKGVYGECWKQEGVIIIDLLKNTNPLRTYIHEMLHFDFPNWTETKVYETEIVIWHRLLLRKDGQRKIFDLYKQLFNRKCRGRKRTPEGL